MSSFATSRIGATNELFVGPELLLGTIRESLRAKSFADAGEADHQVHALFITAGSQPHANSVVHHHGPDRDWQVRHAATHLHTARFANLQELPIDRQLCLVFHDGRRHHIIKSHLRHFGDE